ncbi:Choline/ethanolamine kinase [Fasciolopsis buskii]|uniref:Choline/ethanolamine kinase n=1 Tax=Fasciolopsis buskii TaxID=27845 RepID=A0A8E0VKD2_9TREM|nr:Choline/ethanolamine kinase [Fasciolopsis buski]
MAELKSHVPIVQDEPRKVLIRVYGEVLRSSVDSIVLDSINFAILSEKRIGPALYGVFPGGRIEEFIQVRPNTSSQNCKRWQRSRKQKRVECALSLFIYRISGRFDVWFRRPSCLSFE